VTFVACHTRRVSHASFVCYIYNTTNMKRPELSKHTVCPLCAYVSLSFVRASLSCQSFCDVSLSFMCISLSSDFLFHVLLSFHLKETDCYMLAGGIMERASSLEICRTRRLLRCVLRSAHMSRWLGTQHHVVQEKHDRSMCC